MVPEGWGCVVTTPVALALVCPTVKLAPSAPNDDGIARTWPLFVIMVIARALAALDDPVCPRLRPIEPRPIGRIASFIATYHLGDPAGPSDSWAPWMRR